MDKSEGIYVVDSEGVRGRLESDPAGAERVTVALDDGWEVLLPAEALQRRDDRAYVVPFSFRQLSRETKVPVFEERLKVEKQPVEGGVRIDKHVHAREVAVDVPASHEEVEVERVPVNREVSRPVSPHYEGETFVIPLHEEVLVTKKHLLLREELRITKRQVSKVEPRRVVLHDEEVSTRPIGDDERKDE